MTHTQVCENAMNRECFCDCKGSLHGRNPKRGVFEMKEGYQSNPDTEEKYKTHRDIFYFTSYNSAKKYAVENGHPTDRIIEYERGWAIQYGKSGGYVGNKNVSEWKGVK